MNAESSSSGLVVRTKGLKDRLETHTASIFAIIVIVAWPRQLLGCVVDSLSTLGSLMVLSYWKRNGCVRFGTNAVIGRCHLGCNFKSMVNMPSFENCRLKNIAKG